MQDLTKSPEGAEAKTTEESEATASDLDRVAALLSGKPDDDSEPKKTAGKKSADGDSEPGPEAVKAKGKPKNLDELAEALGVGADDVYGIEIPINVGDAVEMKSLGDIKDSFKERQTFEVDRLAWEEQKSKTESEFLRSNQELHDLVAMLPKKALSKELLNAVAEKRATLTRTEAARTKQVIPEWKDEQIEIADRQAMSEHMRDYGFPENYVDSLVDHRTLRYIRESMLRQQRIERALADVATRRKPGHKPSGSSTQTGKKTTQRRTRSSNSQVSQIAELLSQTG